MKTIAKMMMFAGVIFFFLGASGMDSPSLFAPIMMIFGGMGLIYTGNKLDEETT